MSRRRIAFASIAVVTVLCVIGVSVLAVAAGGSALAYEVNGNRVSQHDFDKQLDDIAGSNAAKKAKKSGQPISVSDGSISSTTASQVLQSNIVLALLRDSAKQSGVEVTDADRAAAKDQVGDLQGAPDSYVELQTEIYAHLHALDLSTTEDVTAFLQKAVRRAHIYVNPRYGNWNPRFGVCPPTGCAAAANQPSSGG